MLSACVKEPPEVQIKVVSPEPVPASLLVKREPTRCLPAGKSMTVPQLSKAYVCKDAGEAQAIASLDALQDAVKVRESEAKTLTGTK